MALGFLIFQIERRIVGLKTRAMGKKKTNLDYIYFRNVRYHLEVFMFSRGKIGARIACWLSIFWLRFLYRLGPVGKFQLFISPRHPLIDDKDHNLMDVNGGDGEYVRLLDQVRNYLNFQQERSYCHCPNYPKPKWFDKVFAFLLSFFPSRVESVWGKNIYSDID